MLVEPHRPASRDDVALGWVDRLPVFVADKSGPRRAVLRSAVHAINELEQAQQDLRSLSGLKPQRSQTNTAFQNTSSAA